MQEIDDDFLPDPRDMRRAEPVALPGLRNTHPAGTVGIAPAGAVPVQLDLDAPVFVDP
ncbi:hypothetical protein D3C79_1083260 [compost metagenome]